MSGRIGALTRREFLARTGWTATGLTVVVSCARWLPPLPTRALPDEDEAVAWLQLVSEGRVRFRCPRSEMGQGISTGLSQVVAEELGLTRDEVGCVLPATSEIAPTLMTVGSFSMKEFFEPTARAAATLREGLRARAAASVELPPRRLVHEKNGFVLPDGRRIAYAELVPEAPEVVEVDPGARVTLYTRDRNRSRIAIGKSWAPMHVEAIVRGREPYSRDASLEGMLYGVAVRPPRRGALLSNWDVEAARRMPGVVAVQVSDENRLAGIVAESRDALEAGLAALALKWKGGEAPSQADLDALLDVDRALERGDLQHTPHDEGNVERAARERPAVVDARYDSPMTAHAAMEPRAALAHVTNERVEIWGASQDPWLMRGLVARMLGRADRDVVVHNQRLGGGFGGRTFCQATLDAAWLSSLARRPVRVHWSRADEFRRNNVGPQFSHRIRAGLDAEGGIAWWDHAMVSCPIVFTTAFLPQSTHWLLDFPTDPGTMRNAVPPYAIPNQRLRFSDVRIPIVTGAWRGLGAAPNAFAVERAMDELALAAGADPHAFRMRHSRDDQPRLRGVLRQVARISRWEEPPPEDRARGLACAVYKDDTYVAVVAEVERTSAAPGYRIAQVSVAQDCGLPVSPDQIRAQIEGNVAWGCSVALHERLEAVEGEPGARNFDSYPILRHSEMPDVRIALLDPSQAKPSGAGEAALVPTPAAIANAVSRLAGEPVRRLPIPSLV